MMLMSENAPLLVTTTVDRQPKTKTPFQPQQAA
jgi:hypothetical protein